MDEIILNSTKDIRELLSSCKLDNIDYLTIILELLDISDARLDDVIFIGIVDGKSIVSAGLFSLSKRKILGVKYNTLYLYGYSFFDYNQIYTSPDFINRYISVLKEYIKLNCIDLVFLENTKNLQLQNYLLKSKDKVKVFDSSLSDKGFAYIFSKKSLKRHSNVVKRDFNYEVSHLRGDSISEKDYDNLAFFHKERWGFDGIQSAFNNSKRLEFYKCLKESALMTIITINGEVFAMHFGMIKNKRLIWHTPVLNVKFLTFSPIEVLLLETAEFCLKNELQFLDFGLGDEKYKNRFSNSEEYIYSFFIPSNLIVEFKVKFALFIKSVFSFHNLSLMFKSVSIFLNKTRNITNKLNLYKIEAGFTSSIIKINDIQFKKITKYVDFVDFVRLHNKAVKRFQFLRFKDGDCYYCLYNDHAILCDGWSKSKSIFISEINKEFNFEKGYVLYDFNTALGFRRKGYYKYLLKNIVAIFDTDLYIYSLRHNIASNKAIQAVGFNMIKKNF